MRNLLIAIVLLLTGGAFYSAYGYKSAEIENDITVRVTDALAQEGAQGVAIDVDGRHVTLTGIVHNEATETAYLDTANSTYGALGPIDGLTYQADSGFLSVVKTAQGISLRGTVPNEETRSELLANAQNATNGAVDDQMTVAGPSADWQEEAAFGLSQMTDLTEGTLMASKGAFSFSGVTNGDADALTTAFADRAGWKTFVASSVASKDLSAQMAQLTSDVSERDATIETLTTELDESKTTATAAAALVATLTSKVEDGENQIASLKGELSEAQLKVTSLTEQIDARGISIERLSAQVDAFEADNEALAAKVAELDTLTQSTKGEDTARIAALSDDLAKRNATIKELEVALGETIDEGREAAAVKQTEIADRDATIAELNGNLGQAQSELSRLLGEMTEMDTKLSGTAFEIDTLTKAADTTRIEVTGLQSQVTDLTATIAARDATIASLQSQPEQQGFAAQQCATQASSAMEGSRINFGVNTARIEAGSVELLERLTGIALACVNDNLKLEIGGHTDAQGSNRNNQRLSERRAQAIVTFMTERGVPASGLEAVGYGETQPVADNATSEGRAQNRRITFDWQAQ